MDKIGKYDIVRQIGEGGFGVVYEGVDPFLKRRVAIKTCTSEAKELRERFFREAEIAGKLQHRHIVTVHDFGVHEEIPYLVQEFLSGQDLDQLIARRKYLPPIRKVEILLDVAKGLEHAHHKGVIHRDIKPGNIRVLDDGSAKILDFGIAKLANVASHLTRTGMTVGTAAYLPPEQIRGAKVDHRADIFSFGVTAHEFLSGQRPYAGKTISKLFYQILNEAAPSILTIWPDCPPKLAEITAKALEKDPEERYPAFAPVIRELGKVHAEMMKSRERYGEGATDIIPSTKREGLTSLGQALVDEEDVRSGQHPTEIEEVPAASTPTAKRTVEVDPGERVVSWAQQLVDEGDPAAAQEALRLFLAETPGHVPASELLTQVESELAALRLQSVREPIEAKIEERDFAGARESLDEAGREGFTPQQLAPMREALVAAETAQAAESAQLEAEIASKLEEPRNLAQGKDFVRAQRLTESLIRHYGDEASLLALRREIEEGRKEEIARLSAVVQECIQESDLAAAEGALRKLRAIEPQGTEVHELARAIEAQRSVERRVGDILRRVEGLIEAEHLDAAFAALKAAETQHGAAPFLELQRRIRKLRRAKLDREVLESIEEGKRQFAAGELGATVTAIEKALAIDPDNEDALAVLRSAQSRLRETEALAATTPPGPPRPSLTGDGGATVRLSAEQIRAAERMAAQEASAELAKPQPADTAPPPRPTPETRSTPTPPPRPPVQSVSQPVSSRPAQAASSPPNLPPTVSPPHSAQGAEAGPVGGRPSAPTKTLPPSFGPPATTDGETADTPPPTTGRPLWLLPALIAGLMVLLMVVLAIAAALRSPAPIVEIGPEPSTEIPSTGPSEPAESDPAIEGAEDTQAIATELQPLKTEETTALPEDSAGPPPTDAVSDDPAATGDEIPPSEAAGELSAEETTPETADETADSDAADDAEPPSEEAPHEPGTGELLTVGTMGVVNASLIEPLRPAVEPSDGVDFSLLYVLVDERGRAEKVLVLPGGTEDGAARDAVAALARAATYEPASRDGVPGRQWITVRVSY